MDKEGCDTIKKGIFIWLCVCVILLSSCSEENMSNLKKNDIFLGKSGVILIETTDIKDRSIVKFYDTNLKKTGEYVYSCGNVGSVTSYIKNTHSKCFVTALGSSKKGDATKVLEIDTAKKKSKEYKLKHTLVRDICVDENNIYSISARSEGDFNSYLYRMNRNNSGEKELVIKGVILSHFSLYADRLVAIGMNYDNEGKIFSKLYEIDKTNLKILRQMDITKYGVSANNSIKVGDKIYFSMATKVNANNEEEDSYEIMVYDLATKKIDMLNVGFSTNQILRYKDNLVITNYDVIEDKGNRILFYNIKNHQKKYLTIDTKLRQIQIKEDDMYILSDVSFDKYNITDTLDLKKKCHVEKDFLKEDNSYNSTFVCY